MGVQLRGLERERTRRGLTLAELARESGVNYTYLTELERGKKLAGVDVFRRVAAVLESRPVIEGADALLAGEATG